MSEESAEAALAVEVWPHARSGLRHSDQLRAILAGMPRPAGARDVDWTDRDLPVPALVPPAPAVQVDGYPIESMAHLDTTDTLDEAELVETAPHDAAPSSADLDAMPFPAHHEAVPFAVPLATVPHEALSSVQAAPAPPQPILWVPTSAFEGAPLAPPAPPVAGAPTPVPVPAVTSAPDPRFVPVPATAFHHPGGGVPTTAWTMRLGFGDPQPVPNPTAPSESMALSSRRRRWRRALTVVLVVMVVASLAVAGWAVYRYRSVVHHAMAVPVTVPAAPGTGAQGAITPT